MAAHEVPESRPFAQRARKSINAGVAAALASFVTSVFAEVPKTRDGWITLVAASLGFGVAAAWTTYQIRNKGTVSGSEPAPFRTPIR